MKLLPRYSLRTLFVVTTLIALLSLAATSAIRGQDWAVLIVLFFVAALTIIIAHQAMFLTIWFFQRLLVRHDPTVELKHSPFATDQLPPQVIEPIDRGVNG